MTVRSIAMGIGLLLLPAAAAAQHGDGAATPSRAAPREAGQFDFLVGQWELTVRPKATGLAARLHGAPRLLGTWRAWRAFDGWGVEDELRIVDGSGNPMALTHTLRVFEATGRRWVQTGLDVYRGRFTSAAASWNGREMVVTSRGTDPEGRAYVSRSRFHDITAASFRMQQDRSLDDGRTWDEAVLRIDARRVADTARR